MLLNVLDALATVALVLALLYVSTAAGCTPLQRLDQALWAPDPAGTAGSGEISDAAQPGGDLRPAPPILELVASGLAAIGFGGMGAWIRRSNKHHKTDLAALWQEMHTLEATVDAINLTTANPATTRKTGPT